MVENQVNIWKTIYLSEMQRLNLKSYLTYYIAFPTALLRSCVPEQGITSMEEAQALLLRNFRVGGI